MKIIKICNVKNIYEARSLGELGVDFVGLHYISASDHARVKDLKMIIRLFHQEHPATKTILVTKEESIERIIELVDEFECDGLQLHYPANTVIFAKLRAHFGDKILLFGVVAANEDIQSEIFMRADYVIIDKSYTGGTGHKIKPERVQQLLQKYQSYQLLLAGGIDAAFIRRTKDNPLFAGYDLQTAVRSNNQTKYENIDYGKAKDIATILDKPPRPVSTTQVGLSCQPHDNLHRFFGACDFWHFDFFDNIFDLSTDKTKQLKNIHTHAHLNSHFVFQIHIFTQHTSYVKSILKSLHQLPLKRIESYIHLSPDTLEVFNFSKDTFASLDIKHLLSGSFPLEASLERSHVLLCLQSEKHAERGTNASVAMNLIHEVWQRSPTFTLDRAITPSAINNTLTTKTNVVSSTYLHLYHKEGFKELKRMITNVS